MDDKQFSDWTRWINRAELKGLRYPGVYVLAISPSDLSGQPFSWNPEIVYIGMTNSKGGLKSRLGQFDNAIRWKEGHGGGSRVRFKHRQYSELAQRLFVSVCYVECDVKSNTPSDLRRMGVVASFEYECIACFIEEFGRLPEFNDKQRSPKAQM